MNADQAGEPANVTSDTGSFVESVAQAANPAKSTLGRVGSTVAAAKVATRLAPAGWRLLKRYPLGASLGLVALVALVFAMRSTGARGRTSAQGKPMFG